MTVLKFVITMLVSSFTYLLVGYVLISEITSIASYLNRDLLLKSLFVGVMISTLTSILFGSKIFKASFKGKLD